MSGTDFQLVKNLLDRFSLSDRTPGLAENSDGARRLPPITKVS